MQAYGSIKSLFEPGTGLETSTHQAEKFHSKTLSRAFCHIQAAPGVKGIIDFELPPQVSEIVGKPQAIAYRNSLEPRGQRILIQTIGVRRIDHPSHAQESRVGE